MEQKASDNEFVVQGPSPEAIGEKAHADLVLKTDDPEVLVVEVKNASSNPKATWQRLLDDADVSWAAPVMMDEGGDKHYPTGDVTVRLKRVLSEKELGEFAIRHGLELRGQNEFVAEQASFRPADQRATYLPDLVSDLEQEDDVEAAWANTKSQFKRT